MPSSSIFTLTTMPSSSIVIKVRFGDILRRLNVSIKNEKLVLDMDLLEDKIRSLFDFGSNVEFIMTYVDEDGDSVTLADDDDLDDAVRQSLNPLRISVSLINNNFNGSSGNSGVSEILESVHEPLLEALAKLPLDLASKTSSSVPGVFELVETLKDAYANQVSPMVHPATGGPPNVNPESEPSTVNPESEPSTVVNPKDGGSNTKKKVKQVEKVIKDVKFKTPYFESESFQDQSGSTKSFDRNKDSCFEKKDDGLGSSHYIEHINQMTRRLQDRMVSQFGRVAADINKNSNDSVNSSSWAHGMLNATNQCPFSGMSLTSDTDTQGHYCHSTDQHVKNFGLDNNGTGDIFHSGICCDGCGVHPITGPRFKSKVKDDYDLCKMCFVGMGNATDYIRIDRPINGFRHLLPPLYGFYDPSPHIPPQMPPHPTPSIWSNLTQSNLDSWFVHDVTVADGTIMAPLTAFTKIWRMKNPGPTIWPYGSQLHWIGGNRMCSSRAIHVEILKAGLHVNEEIDIAVDVTAPDIPGRYVSYWRMASPAGEKFGQRVWILIQVDASMKNSGEDSSNLNLPPVTSDLEAVNQNHPVDNVFAGNTIITDSENTSVDLPPKDQEISFPINDPLIVNNGDMSTAVSSLVFNPSEVVTALSSLPVGPVVSSGLYPSVGLDTDPISYPTVEFSVMPPVMSSGVATPPKVVVPPAGSGGRVVSDEEEQAMVDDLAQMGFKRVNLNKEILRINNYDMEKAIDDLCGVLEWDPLLDELKKMGFADEETNRRLLVKNNGSIKRVVMDLINGKKA